MSLKTKGLELPSQLPESNELKARLFLDVSSVCTQNANIVVDTTKRGSGITRHATDKKIRDPFFDVSSAYDDVKYIFRKTGSII